MSPLILGLITSPYSLSLAPLYISTNSPLFLRGTSSASTASFEKPRPSSAPFELHQCRLNQTTSLPLYNYTLNINPDLVDTFAKPACTCITSAYFFGSKSLHILQFLRLHCLADPSTASNSLLRLNEAGRLQAQTSCGVDPAGRFPYT